MINFTKCNLQECGGYLATRKRDNLHIFSTNKSLSKFDIIKIELKTSRTTYNKYVQTNITMKKKSKQQINIHIAIFSYNYILILNLVFTFVLRVAYQQGVFDDVVF